jgi:hypothetical protein
MIKTEGMGKVSSTHWRDLRTKTSRSEIYTKIWEYMILKWILEKYTQDGAVDWTHLAQDRDQWRALENIVMDLWLP